MRVDFGERRAPPSNAGNVNDTAAAPMTLTIAHETAALEEPVTADLVTDSAIAAVFFILSRALGLASPLLTADVDLFDVIRAATALARGPARILVEGELGVGKESLIKLIHAASRDPIDLVHADCAGLAADALEAEFAPLLAQARSSDSSRPCTGGGAIFFNRIGKLSPAAQRKLLDLLRAFVPVASDRHDPIVSALGRNHRDAIGTVRVLAAATRPPDATITSGDLLPELRDLFDATLTIPPMRARRGDLSLLVGHYLRGLNPTLTFNPAAMRALSVYPFPGNVLELINFVTRVAIIPAKAGTRRMAVGQGAIRIVGRAEVISQLDSGSLNTVWRTRVQRDTPGHRARRKIAAPPVAHDDAVAEPLVPVLAAPASLRLTTATVPLLRKPRGSHHKRPD
jgi:transcriptional regulator of acetoin/glycerol metabolism